MRRMINNTREENGQTMHCPHCGAGADGATVGVYWSSKDLCWKCVICGYRKYRLQQRKKTEVRNEKIWDEIFDAIDEEESSQTIRS